MPGRVPPVALDAMGGDHAPAEPVAGAVSAVRDHGVPVVLVGRAPRIREQLRRHDALGEVAVVHAEEALAMHEGALAGWRRPRSSLAVACWLVRRGEACALVSAGSTGGVVATARLRLRAQQGVLRPAIAAVLPTRPRRTVLLDVGATADAKPEMLAQFASLGTAYAQVVFGAERPRVGLLTIGAEPGKGNRLTRRAQELLAELPDFAGNLEGDDLLSGKVDVIVADGFTGNVALKTIEGAVRLTAAEIRQALTGGRIARLGALLQRRPLRELGERFDTEAYGGAALLGLNGTVVIAHGAAQARAIAAACVLARDLARGEIMARIRERMAHLRPQHRFGWRPYGDRDE
jgi:glycerol-3-phosphate acyltransferase PlsX